MKKQSKNEKISQIPLGDLVEINPDSIKKSCEIDEIEYVDISSVGSGIKGESKIINFRDAPSRARRRVKSKDIILSTVRPNRRSFYYFKNPTQNTIVSTGFAVLRAKKEMNSRFLFYCIMDQKFTDYLTLHAKGAAYPAVDIDTISKAKIPYFPIKTQRKIASILSAYDDLIENNLRRIEILEEMARLIYREWFVHFRFPGHENVRMVDSPLGKIPEGWEVKKMEEVLSFHIGGGWGKEKRNEKHNHPGFVIRGTDIPRAKLMDVENCPRRYHSQSNITPRKLFPEDIIFEVSGGGKDQSVGRSLLITKKMLKMFKEDVICASFCKKISADKDIIDPFLLFRFLEEIYNNGRLDIYQVQSTGIKNFKFSIFLEREKIVLPPKDIQQRFSGIIRDIEGLKNNLGEKNVCLKETRNFLLPKLISGEIDVSNIDIDTGRLEE